METRDLLTALLFLFSSSDLGGGGGWGGTEWEQRASDELTTCMATSAALRTRSKNGNHEVRITLKRSGEQLPT